MENKLIEENLVSDVKAILGKVRSDVLLNDAITYDDSSKAEEYLREELSNVTRTPVLTQKDMCKPVPSEVWIMGVPSSTNCSLTLALLKDRTVVAGFVYDVKSCELFVAMNGYGSYMVDMRSNIWEKISVSKTKELRKSVIGFDVPKDKERLYFIFDKVVSVCNNCCDVKRYGPISLDICKVACGQLDAYFCLKGTIFEYIAAGLILQEAGGSMTDWHGSQLNFNTCDVLVSNGNIDEDIRNIIT